MAENRVFAVAAMLGDGETRKIAVLVLSSAMLARASAGRQSGAVRRFALSRRTSRTITAEISRDKETYRAWAKLLLPPFENVLHFSIDSETTSAP